MMTPAFSERYDPYFGWMKFKFQLNSRKAPPVAILHRPQNITNNENIFQRRYNGADQ